MTTINASQIEALRVLHANAKERFSAACRAIDEAIANKQKPADRPDLVRRCAEATASLDMIDAAMRIIGVEA